MVATLATVPIFVSLYQLPGDMVAGGCNSLVLSAACHAICPVPSADKTPSIDEASDAGGAFNADEAEDALFNNFQNSRRPSTSASSSDSNNDEQLPEQGKQPACTNDDKVKKALIALSQSKLRWGVVPLTPELCDIARETGQEALHLSFAAEETFISPPVDGELYM